MTAAMLTVQGVSRLFPSSGQLGYAPMVWDAQSARRIPSVSKALGIYTGMLKQVPLDAFRGITALPRPRLLDRPDPLNARSWFVQVQVEDYLLNGNAIHYVTARSPDGWPTAVAWLPAAWVYVQWFPNEPVRYYVLGTEVDPADVVHVRRGADRGYPARGVGVVEEHLTSLDRVAMEENYERDALAEGAVPSVAVITPNPTLSQDETDAAKVAWMEKFSGPRREPAILPNGTQVIPLGWSPSDAQMVEARKLSLTDVGNMFNLDGYWLGAPGSAMTYRSPAPLYLNLLRVSIAPVAVDFEDVWSDAWLPRGQTIRFDRSLLLRDDMSVTATSLSTLTGAGIMTIQEAREYLTLPTQLPPSVSITSPVATVPVPDASQNSASEGDPAVSEGVTS